MAGNRNRSTGKKVGGIILGVIVGLGFLGLIAWLGVLYGHQVIPFVKANPAAAILGIILLGVAITVVWHVWLTERQPERRQKQRDIGITVAVLSVALVLGLCLITSASGFAPETLRWMVALTAMGWGLGYFGGGYLIGFLFGIPRVLQADANRNGQQTGAGYEQRVNTNLEQISDWLTKIIVGLGLVQLRSLPQHLYDAARWMALSFVPGAAAGAALSDAAVSFAGAFIVFFSVLGFLSGYLTTRLFLAGAFGRADRAQIIIEPERSVADSVNTNSEDRSNAEKLRNFWKPNGIEDQARKGQLEKWLQEKGKTNVLMGDLVNERDYCDLRKEAVAKFNL